MKFLLNISKYIYPIGLALLALLVYVYIFNPKIDINGDNCYYYILASSLVEGDGFSNIMGEPTAVFPPGYPLLMAPLRAVTDSVIAQKVLNLLFLFVGVLLLYKLLLCEGVKRQLAFIVGAGVLVTPHILEFSTMMMSEPSCIFFILLSLLAFYYVVSGSDKNSIPWRMPWLYIFLFATVYTFFIRTQAVVLFVAFFVALLATRRFKMSLLLLVSFFACYLPWFARNYFMGLGQSRYISQIDFSNIWGNMLMLVVQALPESCLPFFPVNYQAYPTLLLYIIAIVMFVLVLFGFWQMKRIRLVLIMLLLGNIAIVSIMNTPSSYRYMIIVLPVVTAGFIVGVWKLFDVLTNRILHRSFSSWFMLLLFVPMLLGINNKTKHTIYGLHEMSGKDYADNMKAFLLVGEAASKYPDANVVCSRKPELLFVHSGVRGVRYKELFTDVEILKAFIDDDIDYLLLENMGFEYSYEILSPFLLQHKDIFVPVTYTLTPITILFRFNKKLAREFVAQRSGGMGS